MGSPGLPLDRTWIDPKSISAHWIVSCSTLDQQDGKHSQYLHTRHTDLAPGAAVSFPHDQEFWIEKEVSKKGNTTASLSSLETEMEADADVSASFKELHGLPCSGGGHEAMARKVEAS